MKSKKTRIEIPKKLSAEVLYLFDRTCCVCTERGKDIQIHHINEDPSDNQIENLAVLCFECHNATQLKGGFGRKLDAQQIEKYGIEWKQRVIERRKQADVLASLQTTGSELTTMLNDPGVHYNEYLKRYREDFEFSKEHDASRLNNYLARIIEIKKTIYKFSLPKRETEITMLMNEATNEVIDFYEEILSQLSVFYPLNHFEENPKNFFNEVISSKFKWHRHVRDTFGLGQNGNMVVRFVSYAIIEEVDAMIIIMVTELCQKYECNCDKWVRKWRLVSQI